MEMTGPISQLDPENTTELFKSLFFQIGDRSEADSSHLAVVVKNLTTGGAILDTHDLNGEINTDNFKGREGLLKVIALDDTVLIEVPGKILWTRNREDATGVTLGLELLAPLPLSIRQMLEAQMDIGARDMKVLWDYWDEIQVSGAAPPQPKEEISIPDELAHHADSQEKGKPSTNHNWLYGLGFGAILGGIALQYPDSDYLGFVGVIGMFLGSMVVAWKSIMSMRQLSSAGVVEEGRGGNAPCERDPIGLAEREG
jgi:hypothetical protein